jgi:hypothetical protein
MVGRSRCLAATIKKHSFEYTSEQFQKLMADHSVICSMSRSGNVWDNAAMESFFSSLKTIASPAASAVAFSRLCSTSSDAICQAPACIGGGSNTQRAVVSVRPCHSPPHSILHIVVKHAHFLRLRGDSLSDDALILPEDQALRDIPSPRYFRPSVSRLRQGRDGPSRAGKFKLRHYRRARSVAGKFVLSAIRQQKIVVIDMRRSNL